jgi:hypothetical protein
MVVPVRNGAAGDGDEMGLLRSGECLAITDLALVAQHCIHAAFLKAGAHVEDGVAADVEGAADLGEAPAFSQFERDLGAGARSGALVARVDEGLQAGAVDFREHNLVGGQDGHRLRMTPWGKSSRSS